MFFCIHVGWTSKGHGKNPSMVRSYYSALLALCKHLQGHWNNQRWRSPEKNEGIVHFLSVKLFYRVNVSFYPSPPKKKKKSVMTRISNLCRKLSLIPSFLPVSSSMSVSGKTILLCLNWYIVITILSYCSGKWGLLNCRSKPYPMYERPNLCLGKPTFNNPTQFLVDLKRVSKIFVDDHCNCLSNPWMNPQTLKVLKWMKKFCYWESNSTIIIDICEIFIVWIFNFYNLWCLWATDPWAVGSEVGPGPWPKNILW